jgi:hypothetical protein
MRIGERQLRHHENISQEPSLVTVQTNNNFSSASAHGLKTHDALKGQ